MHIPLNVLLCDHFLNYLSLSNHLLPRMNVMLDFIWTLPVQLRRNTEQVNITKNLIHGRTRTPNTARPPGYQSTVFTTQPQLGSYESRNKMSILCILVSKLHLESHLINNLHKHYTCFCETVLVLPWVVFPLTDFIVQLQSQLGDYTFVTEWFAGINCIILWSQIKFYRDTSAER